MLDGCKSLDSNLPILIIYNMLLDSLVGHHYLSRHFYRADLPTVTRTLTVSLTQVGFCRLDIQRLPKNTNLRPIREVVPR